MILLSALLASLTGLVAGERPAARAQVELSAVSAFVQAEATAPTRLGLPTPRIVRHAARPVATFASAAAAPKLRARAILDLKQSWLN